MSDPVPDSVIYRARLDQAQAALYEQRLHLVECEAQFADARACYYQALIAEGDDSPETRQALEAAEQALDIAFATADLLERESYI